MRDYWYRQTDEPLFPDLVWSKPENKQFAGKLLIIGGNSFGMQAPASAYQTALEAGIGTVKVVLPESLHKMVGNSIPDIVFAPSNNSGGFSQQALSEWLDLASWADCVLLAGDTAHNSETSILIEKFIDKYKGKLVITQDTIDQFINKPSTLINRSDTLIVAAFAQLQKMWTKLGNHKPILYSQDLIQIIELLHEYTLDNNLCIMTKHHDQIIAAVSGQVSTTKNDDDVWRVKTSAKASVWWTQNPKQTFEALTSALL